MQSVLTFIAASGLLASLSMAAEPPSRYNVIDLGPVGGTPGVPYRITNNGLIAGAAATPSGTMHAALWYKNLKTDIGTPGLKGPNSAAFGANEFGQVVGQAESAAANSEDFCGFNFYGFPSLTACLPFLWRNGVMTTLATLGGPNGYAYGINNRGETVGLAETTKKDSTPGCPVSQFEPVVWKNGAIQQLPVYSGDTDGVAAAINDAGQVVGASGACAPSFNGNSGLYLVENHALLWESDGSAHDLGNLGGAGGIAGNHACAINNRGEVVGHSELADNATFHGFLWTRKTGMRDLGVLPGDYASLGLGINDGGEVVGASLDANFNPRAYVWKDGVMTDLNKVVASNPGGLYLLLALSINSRGEIVGVAITGSGQPHGFLATPR